MRVEKCQLAMKRWSCDRPAISRDYLKIQILFSQQTNVWATSEVDLNFRGPQTVGISAKDSLTSKTFNLVVKKFQKLQDIIANTSEYLLNQKSIWIFEVTPNMVAL